MESPRSPSKIVQSIDGTLPKAIVVIRAKDAGKNALRRKLDKLMRKIAEGQFGQKEVAYVTRSAMAAGVDLKFPSDSTEKKINL